MARRMAGALRPSACRRPAMTRLNARRRMPGVVACRIAPHRMRPRGAFLPAPMVRRLSAMRPDRLRRFRIAKRVRARRHASAAGHRLRISRHRPPTRMDGRMTSPTMTTAAQARRLAGPRARRADVRARCGKDYRGPDPGLETVFGGTLALASPVQALPACVTRNEGSTPIFASTSVYFSLMRGSKTSSASPGQVSQPFAWISLSSCPGAQPA